jgi:hypothetical protein
MGIVFPASSRSFGELLFIGAIFAGQGQLLLDAAAAFMLAISFQYLCSDNRRVGFLFGKNGLPGAGLPSENELNRAGLVQRLAQRVRCFIL